MPASARPFNRTIKPLSNATTAPGRMSGRSKERRNDEQQSERGAIYWTNEDGTAGYQPFTDDNFEDCQHCGRPHGDEVEIVQGKDRAIVYLHPECEAPYRRRWATR